MAGTLDSCLLNRGVRLIGVSVKRCSTVEITIKTDCRPSKLFLFERAVPSNVELHINNIIKTYIQYSAISKCSIALYNLIVNLGYNYLLQILCLLTMNLKHFEHLLQYYLASKQLNNGNA